MNEFKKYNFKIWAISSRNTSKDNLILDCIAEQTKIV